MRWVLFGLVVIYGCGCSDRSSSGGTGQGPSLEPPAATGESVLAALPVDAAASRPALTDATTAASPGWDGGSEEIEPSKGRRLSLAHALRGRQLGDAPVFVARDADPAVAIRRALDDLAISIPSDRRVVLLVNLGGYDRIKRKRADNGITGRITDVGFTRALILELRRRGATRLAVASGASTPAKKNPRVLAAAGYGPMLAELEVPFVDLNHYGAGDLRPRPWHLQLPWAEHLKDELVLSDDLVNPRHRPFLIVVPKLKAHRFAVMTLSIKNLMGAVMIDDRGRTTPPWRRRWRMHKELSGWLKGWRKAKADDRAAYRRALSIFSERLADLYGAVAPDLVLIEGYPAMQGDGFARVIPYGGAPILIASRNGVYADYLAAEFFGLHDSDALEAELGVRMPPATLAAAERYFGGVAALRAITARGDLRWRKEKRRQAWFKAMAPFEINSKPE